MNSNLFVRARFSRFWLLGLLISVLFLASCSSSKKGKGSFIQRAWHGMNSRYNGYYHAKLKRLKAEDQLATSYKDDYTKVIPVWTASAVADAGGAKGLLDESIKKNTIVLEVHRPYTKWADDALLEVGIAEFLKKDYEKAAQTFEYTSLMYSPYKLLTYMTVVERRESLKEKSKDRKEVAKEKAKTKEQIKKEKEKAKKQAAKDKKKRKKGISTAKKYKPIKPSETSMDTTDPFAPKEVVTQSEVLNIKNGDSDTTATSFNSTKSPDEIKVKNPRKKKKSTFLKRKVAYWDAVLWLARTHVMLKNHEKAESLLFGIADDANLSKKQIGLWYTIMAESKINKKEYAAAQPLLEKAIKKTKHKKTKTRLVFIAAQVNELLGNKEAAQKFYAKSARMTTDFNMGFNAKLRSIQLGSSPNEQLVQLKKMVKSVDNEEYKDLIYYSIAEIEREQNLVAESEKSYKMSLVYNVSNTGQKANSYLRLAELNVAKFDLVTAVNYYDSTAMILPKNDERLPLITRFVEENKEIATNLQTIKNKDSLLMVSKYSKDELRVLAQTIKAEELKNQVNRKALENRLNATENIGISANALAKSDFPLYSEKNKRDNKKEFEKIWGVRAYGDNWRTISATSQIVSNTTPQKIEPGSLITKDEQEIILKDVPKTDEERKTMKEDIQLAYLNLGKLYRNKQNNYAKSVETLQALFKKYPETKYEEEALFYLYNSQFELKQKSAAEASLNKLRDKYPDSKYLKSILENLNPEESQAPEKVLDRQYTYAYKLFNQQNYDSATIVLQSVTTKFGNNHSYAAKYALLSAMCKGAKEGKAPYVEALKQLRTSYPGSPEDKYAAQMLKSLDALPNTETTPANEKFKYVPEDKHIVVLWLKDKSYKIDMARNNIVAFNSKNFDVERLSTNPSIIGEWSIVSVQSFKSASEAKKYLTAAQSSPDFVDKAIYKNVEIMVVSEANYNLLISNRANLTEYLAFFKSKYL